MAGSLYESAGENQLSGMNESGDDKRLFLFPVRRVLMAVTLAYLLGILLAAAAVIPKGYFVLLSMLSLALGFISLKHKKSVLFFAAVFMLLLGNVRAGYEMDRLDMPTDPGVQIAGTISKIEKPYRVYLSDVYIDARPAQYTRDVIITLMCEEGDGKQEPSVGQRISGKGRLFAPDEKRNPGGVDWRIQAICKGYELSGYLLPGWAAEGEKAFSLSECMRLLRNAVNARIEALFGNQAALFQGIMLGSKAAIDEEITAAMRLTGTVHILTVSGLHLSLIAGAVGAMLGCFSLSRKGRFAILTVVLVLFTALTGAAAGTVRACIMAMLRERATLRGRRYEPLTALAFAALCMTLVQPLWLFHASFQFSFFAVLSIQLFADAFTSFFAKRMRLGGRLLGLAGLLAVSLSAQLGSIPMQLMLYGYVPLLSLPMNLLCAMIIPALLLGGWFAAAVSLIFMPAGMWIACILSKAAVVFEKLSISVALLHGAILRLPAPNGWNVLLVLVLFLLLTERIRFGRSRRLAAVCVGFVVIAGYAFRFDPGARYVQLDVGQGDAAIFRSGRQAVLVDVGPTDSYEMLRYLRHEGLYVDAVILSHLDEDHAGALSVLLASEIGLPAVITARNAADQEATPAVRSAMDDLGKKRAALHEVRRGDHIDVNGIAFDVLSPDDSLLGSNERSLLLYAEAEDVSFLLAGDLPVDSEPEYVPQADVLKVAHHGSKNSTSDAFVAMASPALAIISVGEDNRYGHPHARVLAALEDAQILRTDQDGCITIHLQDGVADVDRFLSHKFSSRGYSRKSDRSEGVWRKTEK